MTQAPPNAPGTLIVEAAIARPLCVDLDGTLIHTDTFTEATFKLLRLKPWCVFMLLPWWWRGLAYLKRQIAKRVTLDPAALPYRTDVLAYIAKQKSRGRPIVLATATDEAIARKVADHLGLFDAVIASDGTHNRRGAAKVLAIREQFGDRPFDYIGDSRQDLAVWNAATETLIVNPGDALLDDACETREPAVIFGEHPDGDEPTSMIEALRPTYWLANFLIFLPMLLAARDPGPRMQETVWYGFFAWSLAAAACYLIDDILHVESDRLNPRTRGKPLASGRVPTLHALPVVALLLIAAAAITATQLTGIFAILLTLYVGLALARTLYFRDDALPTTTAILAALILRLLAGFAMLH